MYGPNKNIVWDEWVLSLSRKQLIEVMAKEATEFGLMPGQMIVLLVLLPWRDGILT